MLNETPTRDTSHPTRSHGEIKCWPVVSCESIVSAAIVYITYRMQCCTPYTHTHVCTHIHTHTYTHIHTHLHIYTHAHTHIRTRIVAYTHIHTYRHTHTHTHTHAHTHTHTRPYSAGKCTKASTNIHSKQALSPIHEICRFLWTLKAKKPFVRVSSSVLWEHHLCRQF